MNIKPGNHVKVSVPHQFKGFKIATVLEVRKGIPYVYLWDESQITRYAYVDVERGDTIVKLTLDK